MLELLQDKTLKVKQKAEILSKWILEDRKNLNELIQAAQAFGDINKATSIEALEFATAIDPGIASLACLQFVIKTLQEKAPRIKWESARVIKNIAHLFPNKLDEAIKNLLINSEHPGTVVRWSAAIALAEIAGMKIKKYSDLITAMEAILKREDQNSIKKIYSKALKNTKK
jgi:hypothetical protein